MNRAIKRIRKVSRAYLAGIALAKSLMEMINLMYQKDTARIFLLGVISEFNKSISNNSLKEGKNGET